MKVTKMPRLRRRRGAPRASRIERKERREAIERLHLSGRDFVGMVASMLAVSVGRGKMEGWRESWVGDGFSRFKIHSLAKLALKVAVVG